MNKTLFTCLGGTNHGLKIKFTGQQIIIPKKLKFEKRMISGFGETTSVPIDNETYTYRQFGIDGDTVYGFYALKEISNREAMNLAGIIEVKP